MSIEQRFMAAFEGSTAAHGQTEIGSKRRNGKMEAKSFVVRETLTDKKISEHLAGTSGMGAIPINEDNNCKFGAIDIDTYPVDHQALVRKLLKLGIPMAVCRSKSGGAHLYMFLHEFYPASEVREYLIEIAATLGHSGCEIFPKQDRILSERGDVGNFINLPYFDSENTVRYMVDTEGNDIDLETFLTWVERSRLTMEDLSNLKTGVSDEDEAFSDGYPCLQAIVNMGVPEGTRNTTMFMVGQNLQHKFPDGWKAEMEAMNQLYFDPPLPAAEVATIQRELEKKSYGPKCKEEPFNSHCNKRLCFSRPHGLSKKGAVEMPHIGGLTILLSEPRLYFLDVDGQRLELSTEEIQQPFKFQRACIEQLNFMPPALKPSDWQLLVNDLLTASSRIEVAEELTVAGQFKELLVAFCTSRIRAITPEEIELGKPWTENGKTMFKIKGLQDYLISQAFTKLSRPQIQERLKVFNDNQDAHGTFRYKNEKKGKWVSARVWWVPEFKDKEIELPEGELYEAPF
tara:strand:+ start:2654 stop:4195 length:1542 start_codon:yes stop_codon:yes gene_type:complete